MSLGKYNKEERNVVRIIKKIIDSQRAHRKKWLDLDVKRLNLIHKLGGKYVSRKERLEQENIEKNG